MKLTKTKLSASSGISHCYQILNKILLYNRVLSTLDGRVHIYKVNWHSILQLAGRDKSTRAGILKKSMGARHRVGIGLSYRPARLHRLAEFIPLNRFLGSINV
jgi:hypothetical protein